MIDTKQAPSYNPFSSAQGSQAAVTPIPCAQAQSPLTAVASPYGSRIYVLDGGYLGGTNASNGCNYVLVLNTNILSPSATGPQSQLFA